MALYIALQKLSPTELKSLINLIESVIWKREYVQKCGFLKRSKKLISLIQSENLMVCWLVLFSYVYHLPLLYLQT